MAIHKPFIIEINVGHDIRILHFTTPNRIAGNVAIQVMGKTRFRVRIIAPARRWT
jgi:hypothetical protein